jgi:hypothetical protein
VRAIERISRTVAVVFMPQLTSSYAFLALSRSEQSQASYYSEEEHPVNRRGVMASEESAEVRAVEGRALSCHKGRS